MPIFAYSNASNEHMTIKEVLSKKDWKQFHAVPRRIYRNDPNWICPLESDIESIFQPESNKTFENGNAAVFLLLDDQGRPAGRIAAFVDHTRNAKQDFPTGGVGFFECIERKDYAVALFERAAAYLAQFDVQAIDGPVNFGERERYWGLLVKGHGKEPIFQENYQPPYYQSFFEDWGFRPFEQILTFQGDMMKVQIPIFRRIAQRARERYPFHSEYFDLKRLDVMADHFTRVYNRAFAHFDHFKPISQEQMLVIFKEFKAIADPKSSTIAYYEDRPVGFTVLLPDINPYLRAARGKLNLWSLPGFLLRFRLARKKQLKGIAFGVDPEFQRRGTIAVMIDFLYGPYLQKNYDEYFLTGIRAHNTIMVNSILNLGVEVDRYHVAYRKMLDEDLPFEPFPFTEE